jgi:hypothetical protein
MYPKPTRERMDIVVHVKICRALARHYGTRRGFWRLCAEAYRLNTGIEVGPMTLKHRYFEGLKDLGERTEGPLDPMMDAIVAAYEEGQRRGESDEEVRRRVREIAAAFSPPQLPQPGRVQGMLSLPKSWRPPPEWSPDRPRRRK